MGSYATLISEQEVSLIYSASKVAMFALHFPPATLMHSAENPCTYGINFTHEYVDEGDFSHYAAPGGLFLFRGVTSITFRVFPRMEIRNGPYLTPYTHI